METRGLNNLEQYFTIIYTVSFPSHGLHCILSIVQNPNPILCVLVLLLPFKTLARVPNV